MTYGIHPKSILAAILASFLLISSISYSAPITEAYHPMNASWDGCSEIYQMVSHAQLIYSYPSQIPNSTTLIMIIGPQVPFENGEEMALRSFLERGGTVLLADDYGSGNNLLQYLNVSARFSGKALADLYFYSRTPIFPLISNFAPNAISQNVTAVITDHPTYLEILNPTLVHVVAVSSPFSFVDMHNNGVLSPNEDTQPYPVIATINVDRGLLVLVANANVFDNQLITLFSNQILFRNIMRLSTRAASFDVVHLKNAPLTNARIRFKHELQGSLTYLQSTWIQSLMVISLIAMFSIALVASPEQRNSRGSLTRNQAYILIESSGSKWAAL